MYHQGNHHLRLYEDQLSHPHSRKFLNVKHIFPKEEREIYFTTDKKFYQYTFARPGSSRADERTYELKEFSNDFEIT